MPDSPSALRVVLVEDSPILSSLIDDMLLEVEDVSLLASLPTESEALKAIADLRPDLAIVDLELSAGTGFNVLRSVVGSPDIYGTPHLVVFSNHAQGPVRARCAALGAHAFFDKSFQLEELLAHVKDQTQHRKSPA